MKYYISKDRDFIYTGDARPGDREATYDEVSRFLKKLNDYRQQREAQYPDFRDFLDAQVKINSGDTALAAAGRRQLKTYVRKCLEVKNALPKA